PSLPLDSGLNPDVISLGSNSRVTHLFQLKGFVPVTSLVRPLALAAAVIALASCAPPPPPPPPPGPPPAPMAAPPPPAYAPPPLVRRCARGKHDVGGHRNRAGHCARGHCLPNRHQPRLLCRSRSRHPSAAD